MEAYGADPVMVPARRSYWLVTSRDTLVPKVPEFGRHERTLTEPDPVDAERYCPVAALLSANAIWFIWEAFSVCDEKDCVEYCE